MNYFDIVNQAIELVVVDVGNGLSFLEPRYREVLRETGLLSYPDIVTPEELFEIVHLEVAKRNAFNDRKNIIAGWIAETIDSAVAPAITQEENEFMKNMLAYLERDKAVKTKEEELKKKEQELDMKAATAKVVPIGVNLAKRKSE